MKKRKRFYKNVKRNQTWTEEVQGREIDFAEKYANDGVYSDKFDYLRPKQKTKRKKPRKKLKKFLKAIGAVLLCAVIIYAGYAVMDVYMIRHRMPDLNTAVAEKDTGFNKISLNLQCRYIESVSLDNAVMLSSVITDVQSASFSSVAVDIKRADGTVAYKSALSNVDSYGAVAAPAAKFKESIAELNRCDVLPIGIVYCYCDNIATDKNNELAVAGKDKKPYTDQSENRYLNPDSDAAYRYIKDIIAEANNHGIKIFALCGVNLPAEISDNYNDGFAAISEKIYNDLGTDIKLLEAVEVTLGKSAADEKSTEISEKIKSNLNENQIYFIKTAADKALVKEKLDSSTTASYILAD